MDPDLKEIFRRLKELQQIINREGDRKLARWLLELRGQVEAYERKQEVVHGNS